MCLGVYLRTNTRRTCVCKRLDYVPKKFHYPKFNSQYYDLIILIFFLLLFWGELFNYQRRKIIIFFLLKQFVQICYEREKSYNLGEVTPSYINAYTCAWDLFIWGLFTL